MLNLFAQAAWKVLLAGLVLGAGLPAVFAVGVRLSAAGAGATANPVAGGRAGYRLLGLLCFVVVALAVAVGITIIVAAGFGKMVSFEHIFPTLVDKA
jgi:hypothetical protein